MRTIGRLGSLRRGQGHEGPRRLTPALRAGYMAALVATLLVAPASAWAERVAGAVLPDEARQIGGTRYRVAKSYEDTLKFFKAHYPPQKFPRRAIVHQPKIQAVHIENPAPRPGGWDGLNVYELEGETRVYVLVAPAAERSEKKGGKKAAPH